MSVRAVQVVYIDSDPYMHQALAKVLMALGVSFRCYKSYEEARGDLSEASPNVVFFDFKDYEGHMACDVLKRQELALLAPSELSPDQRAFLKGKRTLSKPLDRHEIAHYLSITLYKDAPKAA